MLSRAGLCTAHLWESSLLFIRYFSICSHGVVDMDSWLQRNDGSVSMLSSGDSDGLANREHGDDEQEDFVAGGLGFRVPRDAG